MQLCRVDGPSTSGRTKAAASLYPPELEGSTTRPRSSPRPRFRPRRSRTAKRCQMASRGMTSLNRLRGSVVTQSGLTPGHRWCRPGETRSESELLRGRPDSRARTGLLHRQPRCRRLRPGWPVSHLFHRRHGTIARQHRSVLSLGYRSRCLACRPSVWASCLQIAYKPPRNNKAPACGRG